MGVRVKASGRYELFEDQHGHRFLVLDAKRWYVWIEGQKSPIIVRTRPGRSKKRVIQKGKFFYVDFEDDPKFSDMPHLFLQKGQRYLEFLLPNGLPDERDPQKRLVVTQKTITRRELENYLKEEGAMRAPPRSRARHAAA
jgi:hypothetical protein